MRRDGIPYVKNPTGYYPPVDYKKLSLDELVDKFIKVCAKAGGKVAVCSQCQSPCEYGKRAIQLTANQIYNDPPVPLYGGKTLIERAKEENRTRREKEELKKIEEKIVAKAEPVKRGKYLRGDEWWKASLAYGDQVEYLEKKYGYSKTKAKTTIYRYRSRHGLTGTPVEQKQAKNQLEEVSMKEEKVEIKTAEKEPLKPAKDDIVVMTLEQKMDDLLKKQDEYKSLADKYTKLYNETKEQVDVLCKAMEMFT